MQITEEEQKKLLQLYENSASGKDDDVDAFYNYLDEIGVDPDEVQAYLAEKQKPTTKQEQRLAEKGKAADDRKATPAAIDVAKIAEAFGVTKDDMENELQGGDLGDYLRSRGVFSRMNGESNESYRNRMRNGFETLGLNFDNIDDRKLVGQSIAHAELMDKRQDLADKAEGGFLGAIGSFFAPRVMEHARKDILNGEETDGYLKDWGLDTAENALMTAGAPASGAVKLATSGKKAQKAIKAFKKGKKVFDRRTNVGKTVDGLGSIGGYLADNAVVPAIMETADAVAYDEPDNVRSDFSGADVLIGTGVNSVAPLIVGRTGGRLQAYLPEGVRGNVKTIVQKAEPMMRKAEPFVTNKLGRSEMAKRLPGVSTVADEQIEKEDKAKKKVYTTAEKHDRWSRGLGIPLPGDRDYDEFRKWRDRNIGGLRGYIMEGK